MNVTWLEATPAALAAAVALVIAGVPTGYALGLRGLAAWSTGALIPPGVLGVAAVVASKAHIPWSPTVAALAVAATTAVTAFGAWICGTHLGNRPVRDRVSVQLASVGGLGIALLIGAVIIVRGLGSADTLSWTWDTTFHYSALAQILDSHDGSSLNLGALGDPGATVRFYPAGWFDIASVVALSTGASIPVAANAVAVGAAVLVWPLSCLFLARQVFGQSRGALVLTGGVSMAFGSFPWQLFYWGALWPYALGQALVPVGLGLTLSVLGIAREDSVGRRRAALLLFVAVAGLAFAHPAAVFDLAALAVFPAGWVLWRWAARHYREGRGLLGIGTVSAVVLTGLVAFLALSSTTMIQTMKRDSYWPPTNSSAGAVGEFLFNAPNGDRALWVLSAVMVVGAVAACRVAANRWILAAHVVVGLLYVMTAAVQSPTTMRLTAFWFNDSHRLAALLPTTGTVLAVLGLLWLTEWVRTFAQQRHWPLARAYRHKMIAIAPIVVVTLAALALTKGFYQGRNSQTLNKLHNTSTEMAMKLAFYNEISNEIPDDAVVANNPEDASPLLWPLFGKRVLFPHIKGSNPKQNFLAWRLHDVATDPHVCDVAQQLHVSYLLTDPVPEQRKIYTGLLDPGRTPGFQLVKSVGVMKLYRITGCGPHKGATALTSPAGR